MTLRVERRADGWWIVGHDPPIGPYRTRAEAIEARRGVARFYRHEARRARTRKE